MISNPQQQRHQGGADAIRAASNNPPAGAPSKASKGAPPPPPAKASPKVPTAGETAATTAGPPLPATAPEESPLSGSTPPAAKKAPSEPPPPPPAVAKPPEPPPVVVSPPPAALPQTYPAPAYLHRGLQLRCDAFEGSTAVMAEVDQIIAGVDGVGDGRPRVVVFIPVLKRHWPIFTDAIEPPRRPRAYGSWVHRPDDYPKPGEDPAFDASFRDEVRGPGEVPPPLRKAFDPPRRARPGYAWAEVAMGPIDIVGFTVDGEKKARGWQPGEIGEFLDRAMTEGVAEGTFVRL